MRVLLVFVLVVAVCYAKFGPPRGCKDRLRNSKYSSCLEKWEDKLGYNITTNLDDLLQVCKNPRIKRKCCESCKTVFELGPKPDDAKKCDDRPPRAFDTCGEFWADKYDVDVNDVDEVAKICAKPRNFRRCCKTCTDLGFKPECKDRPPRGYDTCKKFVTEKLGIDIDTETDKLLEMCKSRKFKFACCGFCKSLVPPPDVTEKRTFGSVNKCKKDRVPERFTDCQDMWTKKFGMDLSDREQITYLLDTICKAPIVKRKCCKSCQALRSLHPPTSGPAKRTETGSCTDSTPDGMTCDELWMEKFKLDFTKPNLASRIKFICAGPGMKNKCCETCEFYLSS